MTFLALCGHVLLDIAFGWILINLRPHGRNGAETLLLAFLAGLYVETLSVATLMFVGVSFPVAALSIALGMIAVILAGAYRGPRPHWPRSPRWPRWYEWILLITIGEKVLFAIWQLGRTHTYFDDALAHWSGRARALFGGVNWSMDPASPFFLARDMGHAGTAGYPLQTVIWRALSAKLNGEWNEVVSRADGLLFFIVILATVWLAVWRFSNLRWAAAAAAFAVCAVPLHAWHAAAGYSDIALEAFVVTAVACLLREEWLPAGIMAAGAVWSKNDGLFLYFPALLAAAVVMQLPTAKRSVQWRNIISFLLGFATITPWLLFNFIHGLGITGAVQETAAAAAEQGQFGWRQNAPALLWKALMNSPMSGVLWLVVFACAAYSAVPMFRDAKGRSLILAFCSCLGSIIFIFSATSAYDFLETDATIHRVMMQFSSTAVIVAAYSLWIKTLSLQRFEQPAYGRIRGRRKNS